MNTQNDGLVRCPRCGAEYQPQTTAGVCPACAFGEALAAPPAEGSASTLSLEDIPVPVGQNATTKETTANPASTIAISIPPTEKPGDRIGRYKLLEQIGEGGCGVVYVAEQEQPVRRRVALKVIKLGMDTRQVIALFEAERQVLALMDHPNIAKVLDGGAAETGRPFFVMELVKGVRITDYCDRNNLSTAERLGLFVQVCHAIQHAHQKGIIHRDIKPSNILVTLHDGVPVPKVIDFGIAKATTDQRLTDKTLYTAVDQFIGTPAYMSPEQAELSGLDVDTRCDIYALGVLLYELLTSKMPFDAQRLVAAGLDEIRRIIREEDPPRPSTRLSTLVAAEQTIVAKRRHVEPPKLLGLIRDDLDWIVMKCLEKDRTRRYETANGLAMDLQRHLHDEPVVARPPGAVYRFRKMARRHKLAFAAATAVALALGLGIIGSTWQAVRARRAEREQGRLYHEAEQARVTEARLRQQAQSESQRAERAAAETKMALATSDFFQAVRLIGEDDDSDALAFLARSLAANPTNAAALTRLTTLLTYHSWPLPATGAMKHDGWVRSAQFSPDGKRIVTASGDKTARVWDAQSGQPLTPPMQHSERVMSAQFSPDGKRIVTASFDKTARGLPSVSIAHDGIDTPSGSAPPPPPAPSSFRVVEHGIVTASADVNTARVWDAQTGQPLTEPMKQNEEMISMHFGGPSWSRMLRMPGKHYEWVRAAQFSPDGKRIVTVSDDSTARSSARVWDAQTGQPLTEPMKHNAGIHSAQFSPDGKRIVIASDDKTARVWDAQTGQLLTAPMKHDGGVNSAQFSPDGRWIVTASDDSTARVWDAQSGQPLTEPMKHKDFVVLAQFSPDGTRIVTASDDKTARVWDARTGQPLTEPIKHKSLVFSAQFSPDGKRIATASKDGTARVWDAQSGEARMEPMKHNRPVSSAQFSLDGKRILTVSTNTARVWDAQTGQLLTETMKHDNGVNSAQFSPDGQRIVTGSLDNTARVWDAQTGQPLSELLKHTAGVWSAQFSPDGTRIVTVSGSTAGIWDIAPSRTGFPDWLLPLAEAVAGERLNPQGVLEATEQDPATVLGRIRQQLDQASGNDNWVVWGRWFLADRATRTIAPFSKVTLPEHRQRQGAD